MMTTMFPDSSTAAALDLHSPQRQLSELRILHADLDALIDHAVSTTALQDELSLLRIKKRHWHCAIKWFCFSHDWRPRSLLELA